MGFWLAMGVCYFLQTYSSPGVHGEDEFFRVFLICTSGTGSGLLCVRASRMGGRWSHVGGPCHRSGGWQEQHPLPPPMWLWGL